MSCTAVLDALISIKPKHTKNILAGVKTVELRRRPIHLPIGARLWIYSTLPIGQVVAAATIEDAFSDNPMAIWRRFGKASCISHDEFQEYFHGCNTAFAVKLTDVCFLDPSVTLAALKALVSKFHPPQFFMKLSRDNPLLDILSKSLAGASR